MLNAAKDREGTESRSGRYTDHMGAAGQQDVTTGHTDRAGWYYQGAIQRFTGNKALLCEKGEPGNAERLGCLLEDMVLLGPG